MKDKYMQVLVQNTINVRMTDAFGDTVTSREMCFCHIRQLTEQEMVSHCLHLTLTFSI
jgi:hypothetical protein